MSEELSLSTRILLANIAALNREHHTPSFIRWRLDVFQRSALHVSSIKPAEQSAVAEAIRLKKLELGDYLVI